MGMFDYINGHQVKCLACELKSYGTGDRVDLINVYPKNLIFLESRGYKDESPFNRIAHIIKDSVVFDSVNIYKLAKMDLSDIEGIYMDDWINMKLNAKTYDDIYNYLYDEAKYNLEVEFIEHSNKFGSKEWEITDKLYEDFKKKWFKEKE